MKAALCVLFSFAILQSAFSQSFTIENNEVKTGKQVVFKAGTATLTSDGDSAVASIKTYLDQKSYITLFRVEGHVSGMDAASAQKLSEQRALAVCRRLVQMGVDCKRLLPVGFGNTKPVMSNDTPEGRTANTRIAFVNAALRGRAIGGMPVDGGAPVASDACN